MMLRAAILAALGALTPLAAQALALEFPPGAVLTARTAQPMGSMSVPVGVLADGVVPKLPAEGSIVSQAWRITVGSASTLQIMLSLRDQIIADGYDIILDCDSDQCGGFDFRYQITLLPEPEMHVDLGDFRYITAQKLGPGGTAEYICLIVSKGGQSGFVQLTYIGAPDAQDSEIVASTMSPDPVAVAPSDAPAGSLEQQLTSIGRAPLEDLSFQTGSSKLGKETFASLAELADYLKANPDKTVALVGHTDAEGSLAGNMALSKKRAAAVVKRLIAAYGIPKSQLEAAGVGYLVPRASNLTPDGRDKNRRVEVILTSTR